MAATSMSTAQLSRQLSRLALRAERGAPIDKRLSAIAPQRAHYSVASSSRNVLDASSRPATSSKQVVVSAFAPRNMVTKRPALEKAYSSLATGAPSGPSVTIDTLKPLLPAKKRQRLGRGNSSGRGGTSTRGHKGQRSRAGNGKPVPGFSGGQTPITRAIPKRGFTNIFAKDYASVTLSRLQQYIDNGRLAPNTPITAYELYRAGVVTDCKDGIKLLGSGAENLTTPITIVVSKATQLAIAAVEQAGGTIVSKYYTASSLDALVHPERWADRIPPRDPDPTTKKDLLYYSSHENRGYLASREPLERPRESPKYLAARAAAQLATEQEEKAKKSAAAAKVTKGGVRTAA